MSNEPEPRYAEHNIGKEVEFGWIQSPEFLHVVRTKDRLWMSMYFDPELSNDQRTMMKTVERMPFWVHGAPVGLCEKYDALTSTYKTRTGLERATQGMSDYQRELLLYSQQRLQHLGVEEDYYIPIGRNGISMSEMEGISRELELKTWIQESAVDSFYHGYGAAPEILPPELVMRMVGRNSNYALVTPVGLNLRNSKDHCFLNERGVFDTRDYADMMAGFTKIFLGFEHSRGFIGHSFAGAAMFELIVRVYIDEQMRTLSGEMPNLSFMAVAPALPSDANNFIKGKPLTRWGIDISPLVPGSIYHSGVGDWARKYLSGQLLPYTLELSPVHALTSKYRPHVMKVTKNGLIDQPELDFELLGEALKIFPFTVGTSPSDDVVRSEVTYTYLQKRLGKDLSKILWLHEASLTQLWGHYLGMMGGQTMMLEKTQAVSLIRSPIIAFSRIMSELSLGQKREFQDSLQALLYGIRADLDMERKTYQMDRIIWLFNQVGIPLKRQDKGEAIDESAIQPGESLLKFFYRIQDQDNLSGPVFQELMQWLRLFTEMVDSYYRITVYPDQGMSPDQ